MKAYKFEVLVIDFEQLGGEELARTLQTNRYISPSVESIEERDIGEWTDGQYARYGISTFGALSFPESTGLWQSSAGAVSEDQLMHMVDFWHEQCHNLPDWSVTQLKNLRW